MPLCKRLERGRFIWPTVGEGAVTVSPAQLAVFWTGSIGGCRSDSIADVPDLHGQCNHVSLSRYYFDKYPNIIRYPRNFSSVPNLQKTPGW